ncbi:MAG: N-acetyltransferase, partial [Pseudomonadota bacterium]|nr:N-acetyltransferase [Pseudomonadota bacterium]
MEYNNGDEQKMINALRSSGRLALSLVVEYRGSLVGHVAFSKGVCASALTDWYALGPFSVDPKFQKRGIGSALIEAGLSQLKDNRSAGCILVGDPHYYKRFGFFLASKFSPPRQPA